MLGAKLLFPSMRKAGGIIDTGLGRTYWRHPTEPGTVISWFDVGTDRQVDLLVFDAAYRALIRWDSRSNTNIPENPLPKFGSRCINGSAYIDGRDGTISSVAAAMEVSAACPEDLLNELWPASIIDTNTARYNCDMWATWESTGLEYYPALAHARSVTTAAGVGADIPNMQEAMRIHCMAGIIDSLDPTIADYPDMSFIKMFNSRKGMQSSTDSNKGKNYIVAFDEMAFMTTQLKYTSYPVIPVLELNLLAA